MAPIPVYTDSPIAAKPDGVTPKTATPAEASPSGVPKPTTTTASTTAPQQASYPPAQPGATPSLPAPTGAAQAYAAVQPTPTQAVSHDSPAPPQPGAAPIPPPPKAGEKYQPPLQTPAPQPVTMPYLPQMAVPSPTTSHTFQQRGTAIAGAPSSSLGSQIPIGYGGQGAQQLQHPPGYSQNANASELDRYQRSAMHQSESEGQPEDTEGVWGAAKKWATQTGSKLAAAEHEVWKKINKE